MGNNEYLSEERYQRSNTKVKTIGKILLIIGVITLIIGFILVIFGFVGTGNSAINGFNSMQNEMVNDFNTGSRNPVQINASGIFGNIGLFALGGFMTSGGFILVIAGGISMFIAHRREITAYTTQQVMPVAQEGIQKMAPTIGNAAKEIAKGIKLGINEANKEQDNDQKNQ